MKRKRFGMNLDEGIPLSSQEEFELLHVECFQEVIERLVRWIQETDRSLCVGGQIGSGKSTLIKRARLMAKKEPDIVLLFDQGTLNMDIGDFWAITLSGFIETAIREQIDLSFCKLPQEFGGFAPDDWKALLDVLNPKEFSKEAFERKVHLRKQIADSRGYIEEVVGLIGNGLEERLGRSLFIFAEGLDKFGSSTPAIFAAEQVVTALTSYKTLFEVNAVHLFSRSGSVFSSIDRLFLPACQEEHIIAMLTKRMGVYAQPISSEIELLAKWSGGNPRQALRLLTHFEASRTKRSVSDSIVHAIRECISDFFAYSPKPSAELIQVVQRERKIEPTLISLPGDKETARRATYGNWILIGSQNEDASWQAVVNPLVKSAFERQISPDEPELKRLREYAEQKGISSIGLTLHRADETTGEGKSGDQMLLELLASGVDEPIHPNLTEVFDVLQAALLSTDRAGRVMIAYKEREVARAARSYLFAKANTYEYQECRHFELEAGGDLSFMEQLEEILAQRVDIISLEFVGEWASSQLEVLDRQRDRFIDVEMVWWIPYEQLKSYLPHWIQLRQLFEIFVLEDELLGSISEEEVKADLAFFADLVEPEEEENAGANLVKYLQVVLDYLQHVRRDEDHE